MKTSTVVWMTFAAAIGATGAPSPAAERGIAICPDEKGTFTYRDDFTAARFLDDAFLDNLKVDAWQTGRIANTGPNRNRTLTYRFHGDRSIRRLSVRIEQSANARNLGGVNRLFLSVNGLDWALVASSSDQKPDTNGWQREPLTVPPEKIASYLGGTEVWVRAILDNHSGLKTNVSNRVEKVEVALEVGGQAPPGADPQADRRAAWGELRQKLGWRGISLDGSDPVDRRPPHYYEDIDGWLRGPNDVAELAPDEREGFPIRRAYGYDRRLPLSLAAFVRAGKPSGAMMARLVVRCTRDSSRKVTVLWDGKCVGEFDAASYFEVDRAFFVDLPTTSGAGVHELRIAGADSGEIRVRRISVIGAGGPEWAAKPAPPGGGSLEVLSAYYLPDPPPPADSQAVEGRTDRQGVGLVFNKMQRLYKEHAEFGAVRVLLRNKSRVPVRIADSLQLNGKPIEASYVDLKTGAWDARGVVWYRVRPRSLEPGGCGEVYIRFRRRPEGEQAHVTVPIENGPPLVAQIPYRDVGLTLDYVTTGKAMDVLYVYARRSPGAKVGRVTGAHLDGRRLADVKVYGEDFPGNVALAVATLPVSLAPHGYHVVGVETDGGKHVAAQFRVLPFVFPRGSIHTPADRLEPMNMNTAMWRMIDEATCRKFGVTTTCHELSLFRVHPRVAYIFGPDEPDAHDNRGGGYDKGLGWHARRLACAGWQELVHRFAPHVATWLIMNGTVRPLNWSVYGQVADVSCFDPYPITYYGADHAYVRESLLLARRCGAPRRMYACLEAYGWGKGQGVPKRARGPIPAEYRQNVVQAIGAGMKGLTSWVYSSGAGGWQLNEPLAKEIARVNALIGHIEGDLLLGTPVDLARSNTELVPTGTVGKEKWPKPHVWVGSLLCGPDTVVLVAVNHIPASKPNPPKIEPARDVTLIVTLPEFLQEVTAFEATDRGPMPFPCVVEHDEAMLRLPTLASGRVFVLRRRPVRH